MGHYPIKCIRCSHIMSNETVLFDTRDASTDMAEQLRADRLERTRRESADDAAAKASSATASFWDNDDEDEAAPQIRRGDRSGENMPQYLTFPEIQEYCEAEGLEPCEPQWQHIDVTPDFRTDDESDLLIGVSFQRSLGGAKEFARRRVCPACMCSLPQQSGSMPTYNITLMGTSAAGKTVYLCMLHQKCQKGVQLPYSTLSCTQPRGVSSEFINRSNALFDEGLLPGTTQIVLTEPLTLQFTFNIQGKTKECLVAMADMRGEDFLKDDGRELLGRAEAFSKADGFMFLVSPLNMPYISAKLPEYREGAANLRVHEDVMANIQAYILPFFDNGVVNTPCAIMVSKCDILQRNKERLGIPAHNPVVAAEMPYPCTGTYFESHDNGTRTIVSCDNSLYSFLKNTFKRSLYTSFSSLGNNVEIEEDEQENRSIKNPHLLHPIRVVDPMVYLLISLGFLPPFHQMNVGNQYKKRNEELLINWMRGHI